MIVVMFSTNKISKPPSVSSKPSLMLSTANRWPLVSKVGQRTESFNLSPEPRTKDRRPQSSSGARSSVFIRKLHCMHFAIKRRYLMKSWYLPSLLCIQTSSTNFHNSEFEERLTSAAAKARARADVSDKFRQG